jgi:hypothetical protein
VRSVAAKGGEGDRLGLTLAPGVSPSPSGAEGLGLVLVEDWRVDQAGDGEWTPAGDNVVCLRPRH